MSFKIDYVSCTCYAPNGEHAKECPMTPTPQQENNKCCEKNPHTFHAGKYHKDRCAWCACTENSPCHKTQENGVERIKAEFLETFSPRYKRSFSSNESIEMPVEIYEWIQGVDTMGNWIEGRFNSLLKSIAEEQERKAEEIGGQAGMGLERAAQITKKYITS